MSDYVKPIRVISLYRIERTWLRRTVILLSSPLLFACNLLFSGLAYALHIVLFTLGFFLFKSLANQAPLIASIKHYWHTSERISD